MKRKHLESHRSLASITLCLLFFLAQYGTAQVAKNFIEGYWSEPSGGIIQFAPCSDRLCASIVAFDNDHGVSTDVNNENAALRSRPLCNLEIGLGFRVTDPSHAEDGSIYDPRNGKTYKGSLVQTGTTLSLRGYVGVKLFGRTEVWSKAQMPAQTCTIKPR